MATFLKEPFVHFLLIGGTVFLLNVLLANPEPSPETEIIINSDTNALVKARLQRKLYDSGRFLNEGSAEYQKALQTELDIYVRDEIMYREGIARALDHNDTAIKSRIASKMMTLAVEQASPTPPTEDEILNFYQQNIALFSWPRQIDIWQVFFDREKRGAASQTGCKNTWKAIQGLDDEKAMEKAAALGDHSATYRQDMRYLELTQLIPLFGESAAEKLFRANTSGWINPVNSAAGCHLIKILKIRDGGSYPLGEVKREVEIKLEEKRNQRAIEAFYQPLKQKYTIIKKSI